MKTYQNTSEHTIHSTSYHDDQPMKLSESQKKQLKKILYWTHWVIVIFISVAVAIMQS